MMESFECVSRIRAESTNQNGDDMPSDAHHNYTLRMNVGGIDLYAQDDRGEFKRIPLTEAEIHRMSDAVKNYKAMLKAGGVNA